MPDLKSIVESIGARTADELRTFRDSAALPDELRGLSANDLGAFVEVLDAHLKAIHQDEKGGLREKSPAESVAFEFGLVLRDKVIARIEEDRKISEVFRRKPEAVQKVIDSLRHAPRDTDDPYHDVRRMPAQEARERALRTLDDRTSAAHLRDDQKTHIERQMRVDPNIARRILVTENDAYRSAWMKVVTQPDAQYSLTDDERRALAAWREFRAASENTTTAGGFGIPVKVAA